jgi:hypothetical protein
MRTQSGAPRAKALAAMMLAWLAGPAFLVFHNGQVGAAESIRPLTNVCQWNAIRWTAMTVREREAWMALGWTQQRWNANAAPASSSKEWHKLTAREQFFAHALGYVPRTWNRNCR